MHPVIHSLKASTGLKQSLVTVVGNTFATGISAVALILISRLLGPVQFGQFSVAFAIVLILTRLNDAGLNATLLRFAGGKDDRENTSYIFAYTLRLKLMVSVVILSLGLLLTPVMVQVLHFSQPLLLYLAVILSVATTWYEHLLAMLQSLHRFNQAVLINAMQSSSKLAGLLVLWGAGQALALPIFSWYMFAPFVPFLFVRQLLPRWLTWPSVLNKAELNQAVMDMARHSAVGFITAGLIENVDILFVQRYLSPFETGLMGGVSRIAMMMSLVAYSLGNVLYPRVARYQSREDLAPYLKKAAIVAGAAVLGWLAFLPFAKWSIIFTIGQEYVSGISILVILTAASFLTIATVPFLALFYSLKANWYFSVSGVLQLVIVLVGNGLFVPDYGLEAAAWTRLVTRLFLFGFTAGLALKLYHQKYAASD